MKTHLLIGSGVACGEKTDASSRRILVVDCKSCIRWWKTRGGLKEPYHKNPPIGRPKAKAV